MFFQAANCCLSALPLPWSGSKWVMKLTQAKLTNVSAVMKAAGVRAWHPATAPRQWRRQPHRASTVPVAKATEDAEPVMPEVMMKAPETES